jgi:hypothetical protein
MLLRKTLFDRQPLGRQKEVPKARFGLEEPFGPPRSTLSKWLLCRNQSLNRFATYFWMSAW